MGLCASSNMLDDAIAIVEQTRNVFNSSLPAFLMHCDELNSNHVKKLEENSIQSFNLCNGNGLFDMSYETTTRRLRSWWCKAATLVLAPVDEVMVVDVDVIFFKNPEFLFTTKGKL